MALNFFSGLTNIFGWVANKPKTQRSDLLIWAKTEYARDWQFAYNHMLDNNGQAPSHRHIQGIQEWLIN